MREGDVQYLVGVGFDKEFLKVKKGGREMKTSWKCLLFFLTVAVLLMAADASRAVAQKPVVIKAVTAWTENWPFNDTYLDWIKRVNEKAKGRLKIQYVGGPEVFSAFEQLDPLKRGVIDTIVTSTAYVAGALPELNATWFGFGATPEQLRASGLFDRLDKILREKAGVTLLGAPLQMSFNVYLRKPIEKADLSGLKLRSTPVYDPALKGLGAATVSMPPSELHTALQTGVVDGFAWPAVFVVGPGFASGIKYKLEPRWWVGTDVALMNARTFDGLSADLKKLLIDTMKDIERGTPAHYAKREKQEDAALAKMGVKIIKLSAAEINKVKRLHWEGGTKAFLIGPSPKYGPQLKKIMAQFAPR